MDDNKNGILNYVPGDYLKENDVQLSDIFMKNHKAIIFFNESLGLDSINEDSQNDSKLKNILYSERIRNNKTVLTAYGNIKQNSPWIKYTYLKLNMYKGRNLITDLSYYINAFMKNSFYKYDKGIDLFFDFINRYINDKRYQAAGYIKKTIFIPVNDWCDSNKKFWDYSKDINIISIIYRLMKTNPAKIKNAWKDFDFVFLGDKAYFKIDFSVFNESELARFITMIKKLLSKEDIADDMSSATTNSIVDDIVNNIDKSNVKIYNLTGTASNRKIDDITVNANKPKDPNAEAKKDVLVDNIIKAAKTSNNANEAMKKLDSDTFAAEILDSLSKEAENSPNLNVTRTAKTNAEASEFMKNKKINGRTVSDILNTSQQVKELPTSNLNINTINKDWNNMKYVNFEKVYDLDADIVKILYSFSNNKTNPITIIDINKEDTSDAETHKFTYTVKCRTASNKNFTLKFDVPKFKNGRFMKLRGNDKTMNGQLILLPIIKTDQDTAQIVSNYNKIFIRRYGATAGKSFVCADKIIKTLNKIDYSKSKIKVSNGDNSKICSKYELPYDYIDLASVYNTIETPKCIWYFNQDIINEKYKDIIKPKGIPVGYSKIDKSIIYYSPGTIFSMDLASKLNNEDEEFANTYSKVNQSSKYTYSKASILNTEIPVIVIMGYNVGLQKALDKADIKYTFVQKKSKGNESIDSIKFEDGYLEYEMTPASSLLMNGLKECDTANYSLKDINNKSMWLDFLDDFGGRIKADGLDNFYDLMMDPITQEVCERYDLPTDYIEALAYANILLSDNKYNKHVDITGNRLRTNELVAAYTYKVLAKSYADYSNQLKRSPTALMTIKQSQIIDSILTDSITSDLSILNPLLELESSNSISFKGPSGMNSDRSYGLDKRTYDESMLNILGMSTGFAGNVGITRYATMDANIEGPRGYIKPSDGKNFSAAKTLTATEAMTPFGTTGDDPFRTAMTFIQTSKHAMRVYKSDPLLVTNGADRAIPYLVSDTFAHKAKEDGVITELNDDYMIITYNKSKNTEFVDLRSTVRKNSDGGMYLSIKLEPKDVKVGTKVKPNQIVAYDPLSFNDDIGYDNDLSCDIGTLSKVAIMQTDEGYEDSAIISEWLSEAMSSDVIIEKEVVIPKNANIYNMVKKHQSIQEGDPLIIFQNAFDDNDLNVLLKNISDEDDITDLGRIPIKSKITGVVEDIQILRTVDIDDMSDSLKKVVKEYESDIRKIKTVVEKYDKEKVYDLPADYKLEPTGRLKNAQDSVLIKFYLKYKDKMAVGDKLVYYSALKGVTKNIFEEGSEPYTDFRPDEKVHALLPVEGIVGRMVTSVKKVGSINKIMIELDRKVKDIMGIKWEYLDN